MKKYSPFLIPFLILPALLFLTGCTTPAEYRKEADKVATNIIIEKQKQLFGHSDDFSIERPSDILRRKLLIQQKLPYAGNASLGTDKLPMIKYWPEESYPQYIAPPSPFQKTENGYNLNIIQALQISARNSFEYQQRKEDVFRVALDLDLEQDDLRITPSVNAETKFKYDKTGEKLKKGFENSLDMDVEKKFPSGVKLGSYLALDLVQLLSRGGASSFGIVADATISIPLLRGSGKHIVFEPILQAQRDVVYEMYEFERYKKTFAVQIVKEYLDVLRFADQVKNNEINYQNLVRSSARARSLADAGRLNEIQVDQAIQSELKARIRWIGSIKAYENRLDSYKNLIGLPPDAEIFLDETELTKLRESYLSTEYSANQPERDLEKKRLDPSKEKEANNIHEAFENRLDLRVSQGKVYDAQRGLIVLADALGAELTLFGKAELGQSRNLATATSKDARLTTNEGIYTSLLSIDLPIKRTAERNAYRNGYIRLERAVRDVQKIEDMIKIALRETMRDLVESLERIETQKNAVALAQKRVQSVNLFLEAGRAEIRDLNDAEESALTAQNGLTNAIVDHRVAQLALQRDIGLLTISEIGR